MTNVSFSQMGLRARLDTSICPYGKHSPQVMCLEAGF